MNTVEQDGKSLVTHVSGEIPDELEGVLVFFCIRNEKFRLPYFLDYYRKLGVKWFFAVDNNSTDDTSAYLQSQSDVILYFTDQSYKDSNAGRAWTSQLARSYGMDKWCLTLDVDEFLIFPGSESLQLLDLCDYCDYWGYKAVNTIFLDFYSDKSIDDTKYEEGQSVFEVCEYYDHTESYRCINSLNFPYLQIKGGPRQRVFWDSSDKRSGPSMRKVPLVFWNEEFDYLHSTHSTTEVVLADMICVLAHFKFMDHFKEHASTEVARNDRVENSKDWKVYTSKLHASNDLSLHDENVSVKFRNSFGLIEDGFMPFSLKFFNHKIKLEKGFEKEIQNTKTKLSDLAEEPISYSEVIKAWPSISNLNAQLPYSGQGRRLDDSISMLRIEDTLHKVLQSRLWKISKPLRVLSHKTRLADRRVLLDESENIHQESLYTIFKYTYDSIWWDLLAPLRIVKKIKNKIARRFKNA